MKVDFISYTFNNKYYNNVKNPKPTGQNNVSFRDNYQRYPYTNPDLHTLSELKRNELNKIIEEMNSLNTKDMGENEKRTEYIDKINSIKREYERIDEMLNRSKGSDRAANYSIIVKYFENRSKMKEDEGFNQIIGYNRIKNKLSEEFCIDIFLKDKLFTSTTDKVKVPDIVFFYGPTGTGKTTFAKALAQETQSNIVNLDLTSCFDNNEKLNMIEQEMKKSLKNYEASKNDKSRTIILINEADSLIKKLSENNPKYFTQKEVVNSFIKLVKDCSEKYKCTIFITTNEPLRVDKRVLDEEITPIKVALGPCDLETARGILEKNMHKYGISADAEKIAGLMFKDRNYRYSNSNIVNLVENVVKTYSDPTTEDFISILVDENGPIIPGIKIRDIAKFEQAKQALRATTDPNWQDL